MNAAEVKKANFVVVRTVAERMARDLCGAVRRDWPRKRLLAIVTEQVRSVCIRCPACMTDVPVMLLGRDDAQHVCIVARRSNFLSLRRRLEERFLKARLMCPSCKAMTQDLAAEDVQASAGDEPCEAGDEAPGAAWGAGAEQSSR